MAKVIDGRAAAQEIKDKVSAEIAALREETGKVPGLAVILVGNDPGSETYVRMKEKTCAQLGMESFDNRLPVYTTEEELLRLVDSLCADARVSGILVQRPLPSHISANTVSARIAPAKDVDAFHPENVGNLVIGSPLFYPCTPLGIMHLLDRAGVEVKGKKAVVLGRSDIVGKPVALMLLHRHATVTLCHTRTRDLPGEVGAAEVLIAAAGRPGLVRGDWIREGAAVIDVGVNRLADGKLVGDVEFETASKRAAVITPVPGGVGPMTIAMLMSNTLEAFKRLVKAA